MSILAALIIGGIIFIFLTGGFTIKIRCCWEDTDDVLREVYHLFTVTSLNI